MREVGGLEEREGQARAVQSQDSHVKQREDLGDGHDPLFMAGRRYLARRESPS